MDNNVRRSKIYSYFYGANTVFQQFIIIAGILMLMMTSVAGNAAYRKAEKQYDKVENLEEEMYVAENEYEEYYDDYSWEFDVDWCQEATIESNDEYKDEKKEYNAALEKYEKARVKYEEAYTKFRDARGGNSFFAGLLKILGYIAIIAGALWFIYKKIFGDRSGESAVDAELAEKIEEAKAKGMEKLNIISEQIERVEPIVLNGIGYSPDDIVKVKSKGLISSLVRGILSWDKMILGIIASAILVFVFNILVNIGIPFFIVFVLMAGVIGAAGYFAYGKYEVESYVKPKTIERLNNFPPHYMERLGSDDALRVSLPAITVYMFGDDQLYMYYQYLDIVTGKIFCEGVQEYFYEDIVAVTSAQEVKKAYKAYGFLNLRRRTIDYLRESITVVSSGCMHKESYVVDMGNSLLDTKFVGMRNLIRQKKMEK